MEKLIEEPVEPLYFAQPSVYHLSGIVKYPIIAGAIAVPVAALAIDLTGDFSDTGFFLMAALIFVTTVAAIWITVSLLRYRVALQRQKMIVGHPPKERHIPYSAIIGFEYLKGTDGSMQLPLQPIYGKPVIIRSSLRKYGEIEQWVHKNFTNLKLGQKPPKKEKEPQQQITLDQLDRPQLQELE